MSLIKKIVLETPEDTINYDIGAEATNVSYDSNKNVKEKLDEKMGKGSDYVTAGQLSGSTLGDRATAEGEDVVASFANTHAEGYKTTASGANAHAEGSTTVASGAVSHAEGSGTSASGESSHAEGFRTTASGQFSHAEGYCTIASEQGAHTEGYTTTASKAASHAEGESTLANGYNAHTEGQGTIAGYDYQHVQGKFNNNNQNNLFEIGNGTASIRSNAFSVSNTGVVKAASTITASTTADYAENFEQYDGNQNNEDRVGYFVTFLNGNKIVIAEPNNDYILGIVSGEPFVLGNGDCDVQNGMVMRDEYRRVIYEPAPKMKRNEETGEKEPVYDEQGNPVYEGIRPVYNPDYNPSIPYISRANRPEWSPIGMLGVLCVRDNGECQVNQYCTVGEGGIAVPATLNDINKWRVIKRNSDNVIEIIFR